jgi:RNA polymerase sigma-B factor
MSSVVSPTATSSCIPLATDNPGPLFLRWQRQGDQAAREALIQQFMPLARSLARRYRRSSEPFEDLLQVASMGLLQAIDRFDPDRGHPFPAFAVPTILGEMRRYFRDCGWPVHLPRAMQERALKVRVTQDRFTNERGHAPTVGQLAEYLELDIEQVVDALQAVQAYQTLSLDTPPPEAEREGIAFGDATGREDECYELIELGATIAVALEHLPARERHVLHMHFVEDLTQAEIAARIGVSQMQVSRLLRRSLDTLRTLTGSALGSS